MVVRDTDQPCIFPYCGETLHLSYICRTYVVLLLFRQGVASSQFLLVQNRKVAGVRFFLHYTLSAKHGRANLSYAS